MTAPVAPVDRAAAVRVALRTLVARHGFHGASMSAVAAEAGVATGTAYVHYRSKDDLVIAAYLEVKRDLGEAAVAAVDVDRTTGQPLASLFRAMWLAVYEHLSGDPDRARFLLQVEVSPYAEAAHAAALAMTDDRLLAAVTDTELGEHLVPLPPEVLYDLGIAPAVRLATAVKPLAPDALRLVADACWRAISTIPAT